MSQNDVVGYCGCYVKTKKRTPANLSNPSGLSSLKYRVGTHGQFKADMIDLILRKAALKNLTTREDDDLCIALLDSWATIADVLTFYQERIANEGYLRTATERRSVLELARTIGYELKPGVAAGVPLVFMVESSAGAPLQSRVDEGTKVMSVPGQDEKLQVFETIETIEAKAALNDLRPIQFTPNVINGKCTGLYLAGVNTHLVPGDAILLVGSERLVGGVDSECWDFRFLHTVTVYSDKNYTHITWKDPLGHTYKVNGSARFTRPAENPTVFAFRQRASFFGYNAPDWKVMPDSIKAAYDNAVNGSSVSQRCAGVFSDWPGFDKIFDTVDVGNTGVANKVVVHLDAVYPKILPESWIVFAGQRKRRDKQIFYVELCRVTKVEADAQSDFTLNAKTTKIELDMTGADAAKYLGGFLRRDTVVFCVSEPLEITDKPLVKPVSGNEIVLDRKVSELKKGQKIVVQGKLANMGVIAPLVSEVALIRDLFTDETTNTTTIALECALSNEYDLASVHIYANVAFASHGETVYETLGSGNSLEVNQQFRIKKIPLTYVSATTPSGARSTLKVYVNDVQWQEVPTLYDLSSKDLGYFVRVEDNGETTVNFGDGLTGARLPSGVENVTASYRSGIGLQGSVAANKLTLLTKKPFGIRSVTNPIAASGAASPEKMVDAKINAPSTVLTLGRIVSLKDYENFARNFLGIAKACANVESNGGDYIVQLIVAPVDAKPLDATSMLYRNLKKAIDGVRAHGQKVHVKSFNPVYFNVESRLYVDSDYHSEEVKANVKATLINTFSFDQRSFKQAVTSDEVLAVIQAVPGIIYADKVNVCLMSTDITVDTFSLTDDVLLMVNPEGITLGVKE
jgi:hypothetical protein